MDVIEAEEKEGACFNSAAWLTHASLPDSRTLMFPIIGLLRVCLMCRLHLIPCFLYSLHRLLPQCQRLATCAAALAPTLRLEGRASSARAAMTAAASAASMPARSPAGSPARTASCTGKGTGANIKHSFLPDQFLQTNCWQGGNRPGTA